MSVCGIMCINPKSSTTLRNDQICSSLCLRLYSVLDFSKVQLQASSRAQAAFGPCATTLRTGSLT